MASPVRKSEPDAEDGVRRIPHRAAQDDFRWDAVEMRPYKEDERALYKAITRQVLFSDPDMAENSAISRSRPAASPRWSATSTCTAC